MIDKGIVEIGGKRIEVAREDIRKLKFIMDELGIMHLIDNVAYIGPCDAAEGMEKTHNGRMREVKIDGNFNPKKGCGHQRRFEFQELIIPIFFKIDFMSPTQLDCEEAEFLGDLLYGPEY
jgi:hypothetical protein